MTRLPLLKLVLASAIILPLAMPGCASTMEQCRHGVAPMSMRVDAQSKVLAQLLAGKWEENRYYTKVDFNNLSVVTFAGGILKSDGDYVESIYDPKKYEVKRTVFGLSGRLSGTEIVSLPQEQFWALVIYVQKYFAKHGTVPSTPISLVWVEALFPGKESDCKT